MMWEGPFTGPCQCTNECEVLSGLLCMTITDTAQAAKCKLPWVVWAWDLNCKGQKTTSRNQNISGWQGLQKAFIATIISKPVQLWGQTKPFKALPRKIEISRKYLQIYIQKISKVPSSSGQPAPMLYCPHVTKVLLMFSQKVSFQFVNLFPLCEEHGIVLKTSSWDSLVQGNCFLLFAREWLPVFCLILDKSRTDLEQVPKVWLLGTWNCYKAFSHKVLDICMYSVLCRNFVLNWWLGLILKRICMLRI